MKSWVLTIVIAAALTGAAAWFLTRKPAEPPPPPAVTEAAPPKPADATLPPPAETDARLRKELTALSPRSELGRWLAGESDLLTRWLVVADNLAEDVTPRKQLAFLAPAKPFMVKNGRIDPRSYARYDGVAEVIASVDAKGFAALVRDLKPLLETAYHQLGYPDRHVDDLARGALQRLIDAPAVDGEVKVAPKGGVWRFADDKLEAKGAVEKHLLRMGPRNTRLNQAKARDLAAALDLRIAAH